jgi:hypothetical protein
MIVVIMHKFDKNPKMVKYFAIIAALFIVACSQSSQSEATANTYQFSAQNHNIKLDHQMGPIIQGYQEILKGLISMDTFYMKQSAMQLVHLTDSIQNTKMELDSNVRKIWVDGLGNLNAELQGLIIASTSDNREETQMTVNMCALQLINLLGQIGYKEHTIYIFNTENDKSEDGFVWISMQKTSRDPFHPDYRKEVSAQSILQEGK